MTTRDQKVRIWGIVPAAGTGRRMGRPKQTLPFRGSTLAGTVTRTLLEAGADGVVVVTRTRLARALELPHDPRVRIALNDKGEMIDSVRVALAALAGETVQTGDPNSPTAGATGGSSATGGLSAGVNRPRTGRQAARGTRRISLALHESPLSTDGVAVVPADMPTLSAEACRTCIRAYAADPHRIVIATYSRRRGHPIIFPFAMRDRVDGLHGGLNELPRRFPQRVHLVAVDDPGVTRDVDTPLDYDRFDE